MIKLWNSKADKSVYYLETSGVILTITKGEFIELANYVRDEMVKLRNTNE